MTKSWTMIGVAVATLAAPVSAETLREALLKAYGDNPTITAQRDLLRATDETVPIAKAAGRPSITANSGVNENFLRAGNSINTPERLAQVGTSFNVPIFQGGAVRNSVKAAETRVEAGRAQLRGTESQLFTDVVTAYNNVLRDEAIVSLNMQNVQVLDTNLRASRDRFQVGDLTRTDVAQSEARLALARAQLQTAQATLIGSRENYVRLVGTPPVDLQPAPPLPPLPASSETAAETAVRNNPALLAALKASDATAYDVKVARAGRLPRFGVSVGPSYLNYLGTAQGAGGFGVGVNQSAFVTQGGINLSLPLFQGGLPAANIRRAQALRSQAIENATAAERQVIANARSAYAMWRSSQEVIQSAESAVAANKLSLEGVRAENSVGTRTILDILNAEQELLNSQVTLVTARRDAYVAGFTLLAAMGEAEASDLNLQGGALYDPTVHYDTVRNRFSDYGSDATPVPQAASTIGTPAQNAVVTRPLDPALDTPVDSAPALTTGAQSPDRR